MPNSIIKQQYLAMQPEGILGAVKSGSDEDHMYNGLAADVDQLNTWLESTADIRNPANTPILVDLEWEYGIIANSILTEAERRNNLSALVYAKKTNADKDTLEQILVKLGHTTAKVYDNDPVTDPGDISMGFGSYVVNGEIFQQYVGYKYRCKELSDPDLITCKNFGDSNMATAGAVEDVKVPVTYNPAGDFAKVFFIGSSITIVGGVITAIGPLTVDVKYKDEFLRTVLRHKPLDSWALINVDWGETTEVWQDVNSGTGAEEIQDVNAGTGIEDIQDVNS